MLDNIKNTPRKKKFISGAMIAFFLIFLIFLLTLRLENSYAVDTGNVSATATALSANGNDPFSQFCNTFYNVSANSSDKYTVCLSLKPLFQSYLQSHAIAYGSNPIGATPLTPVVGASSTPTSTSSTQNPWFHCIQDGREGPMPTNTPHTQNSWASCTWDGGANSTPTDPSHTQNPWSGCMPGREGRPMPPDPSHTQNPWSGCSSAGTPGNTITPTPAGNTITPTPAGTNNAWPNVSLVGLEIPADAGQTGNSIPYADIAQVEKDLTTFLQSQITASGSQQSTYQNALNNWLSDPQFQLALVTYTMATSPTLTPATGSQTPVPTPATGFQTPVPTPATSSQIPTPIPTTSSQIPTPIPTTSSQIPTPIPTTGSMGDDPQVQAAQAVFAQINQERAGANLPALQWSTQLVQSAHSHNLVMQQANQLSHQLPNEPDFGTRISNAGIKWTQAAENIGMSGGDTSHTPTVITTGLNQSMFDEQPPDDGHRLNILSTNTLIGIDVIVDTQHGNVWLTEDFAKP